MTKSLTISQEDLKDIHGIEIKAFNERDFIKIVNSSQKVPIT